MSKATLDLSGGAIPCYLAYVEDHNANGAITGYEYYLKMEVTDQLIAHIGHIDAKDGGFIVPGQPETIYPTFEEAGRALYKQWQAPKPASREAVHDA